VSLPRRFRYCGFTHVRGGETPSEIEGHREAIFEWLKGRFELYHVMSEETADSGRHVQWYGETNIEWSKADTNVHGKKGLLGKHIPETMRAKHAKRWSHETAKKSREENALYVGKGGMYVVVSDGDVSEIIGRWEDNRDGRKRKVGRESFHSLVLRLWNENGQPRDHKDIYLMLVKTRAIPWNNFSSQLLYKASDWILSQVNMEATLTRFDRMYEEVERRTFGIR